MSEVPFNWEWERRIAELEAICFSNDKYIIQLQERMDAMAAILDTVPHFHTEYQPLPEGDVPICDPHGNDCPACAWARLKACE